MAVQGSLSEKAAKELDRIAEKNNGKLTPGIVLTWAEMHPTTALGRQFCWDDGKAAHKYRIEQAARLIRLRVTVVEVPKKNERIYVNVRKYVSLSTERKTHENTVYRETESVVNKPETRSIMLADAISELAAFQRKYITLSELKPVFDAFEQISKDFSKTA